MDTFSLVFRIPPITDIIAFRDAIDKAEAVLNEIGAEVLSCRIAGEQPTYTAHGPFTSEEESEFNGASTNNSPAKPITGWRPVTTWDGQKDPNEMRPGQYRQAFNEDGTPAGIEFLPEGEF